MSVAQDIANALHRFNAKERNSLMRFALLGEIDPGLPTQSTNWVNSNFFQALKTALQGDSKKDDTAGAVKLTAAAHCVYAAMDYHLDWLHGALWCVGKKWAPSTEADFTPVLRRVDDQGTADRMPRQRDVMGNQEDVDLLLVIEDGAKTHVVFVEAKGVSAFSEDQLMSKFQRLQLILAADHVLQEADLLFSMVLLAPGATASEAVKPARKHVAKRIGDRIFPMVMPNFPTDLYMVTRCNEQSQNPQGLKRENRNDDLPFWKIKPR
jgi:hypothetical protein